MVSSAGLNVKGNPEATLNGRVRNSDGTMPRPKPTCCHAEGWKSLSLGFLSFMCCQSGEDLEVRTKSLIVHKETPVDKTKHSRK